MNVWVCVQVVCAYCHGYIFDVSFFVEGLRVVYDDEFGFGDTFEFGAVFVEECPQGFAFSVVLSVGFAPKGVYWHVKVFLEEFCDSL